MVLQENRALCTECRWCSDVQLVLRPLEIPDLPKHLRTNIMGNVFFFVFEGGAGASGPGTGPGPQARAGPIGPKWQWGPFGPLGPMGPLWPIGSIWTHWGPTCPGNFFLNRCYWCQDANLRSFGSREHGCASILPTKCP